MKHEYDSLMNNQPQESLMNNQTGEWTALFGKVIISLDANGYTTQNSHMKDCVTKMDTNYIVVF